MPHDWSAFPHHDLEEAKKFGCDFYGTIGRIKCPALGNEYVAFNSKGLGHILDTRKRAAAEVIARLSFLQHVEAMVIDPFAKIEYRKEREKDYIKKQGRHQLVEVEAQYWGFVKEVAAGTIIKAVVRQLDNGGKYFYSIMRVTPKC